MTELVKITHKWPKCKMLDIFLKETTTMKKYQKIKGFELQENNK